MTTIRRQQGAVILALVFVLLGTISLLLLYVINAGIIGERVIANEYQTQQAYEAASAGLDYGMVYLLQNSDSILVDDSGDGFINANSFSQTLNNGATFTLNITNPTANDFHLLQVTVTGNSADGSVNKRVSQLVKFIPYFGYLAPLPLAVRNEVDVGGSAVIRNSTTSNTIWAGDDIDFSGSGHTESNDGSGSSVAHTHTDIVPDSSSLDNLSEQDFFKNFFGTDEAEIKSAATLYYQSNDNRNYNSELNEKQGELIWIDQTGGEAIINSNTQIGTADKPVIMVVNGDLNLYGSAIIYGIIFVTGNFTAAGTEQIFGGVIVGGDMNLSGFAVINYDNEVSGKVQETMGEYLTVPGSWKD